MITNEHMTEMRIKSKKSQDRNEQDFTEEVQVFIKEDQERKEN